MISTPDASQSMEFQEVLDSDFMQNQHSWHLRRGGMDLALSSPFRSPAHPKIGICVEQRSNRFGDLLDPAREDAANFHV